jgi:hypothetical protein
MIPACVLSRTRLQYPKSERSITSFERFPNRHCRYSWTRHFLLREFDSNAFPRVNGNNFTKVHLAVSFASRYTNSITFGDSAAPTVQPW